MFSNLKHFEKKNLLKITIINSLQLHQLFGFVASTLWICRFVELFGVVFLPPKKNEFRMSPENLMVGIDGISEMLTFLGDTTLM